jgi:hypothetical protein
VNETSQYFSFVLGKVFDDILVILIHTLIEFFFKISVFSAGVDMEEEEIGEKTISGKEFIEVHNFLF